MTKVTARKSGGLRYLCLDGHATGNTAVCNMISGLVCTLAGWLRNLPPEECSIERLEVSADRPGYALLEAQGGTLVQDGFDFTLLGLLQLQKQFPELVTVIFSEK